MAFVKALLLTTLSIIAQIPYTGNAQAVTTTSSSGARFTVPASADYGAPVIPNIKDSQAVDSQSVCPGYRAENVQENANGLSASLRLAGQACNTYGTDIDMLNLTVEYQSLTGVAVHIEPAIMDASNTSHYVLSNVVVPRPQINSSDSDAEKNGVFNVTWSNEPTFSFTVTRKANSEVVFSTLGTKLVYQNQFIEFVTSMPQDYNIYGLGERIHELRLGNNFTATSWAADAGTPLDYNIYGTHPVYLDTRYYEVSSNGSQLLASGSDTSNDSHYTSYTHAVYNRNAHGSDVLLRESNITWRALGGSIDLFFFDGPTPSQAISNYQRAATGFPALQQYWTFGFNQCRWGYANWTQLREIVDNFKRFDLHLETIWTDIDYMDQYRDFTVDENTFPYPEGQKFLEQLHSDKQYYIPIVDSAIYIPNPQNGSDAYPTYNRGNDSGVFLKNPDGSQYIGTVWPGYTVFPDWHAPKAVDWWVDEVTRWHQNLPFDGIWIDMSEVSSFCVGSCGSGNLTLNPVHVPFLLPGEPGNVDYRYPEGFNITNATEAASASSASSAQASSTSSASQTTIVDFRSTPTPNVRNVNQPPYAINHVQGDLAVHAVSPNATHADGVLEYDVHNLYGHQILNATYQALLNIYPAKRPVVVGRSTFVGSGKWAGHWLGDNVSSWVDMFFAIPQALSFSIFGIPHTGPDVCGFAGNSDEELCNRWMQLGAFFPFYRNHNVLQANSQEPYVWASVIEATKKTMRVRYALLPYMYTLFHAAHTRGETVMRALAWEFPSDPSLRAADRQFLLGPALMITPVLNQGYTNVSGVFPGMKDGTRWFDWWTHSEVTGVTPGQNVTIQAPLGHIPVYIRGGYILPMQEPGYTTAASRNGSWALIAALDDKGLASGDLYIDDGVSVQPETNLNIRLTANDNSISAKVIGGYDESHPLANVTILGVSGTPGQFQLNGQPVKASSVSFDETTKVLSFRSLEELTSSGAWKANWTLSWSSRSS